MLCRQAIQVSKNLDYPRRERVLEEYNDVNYRILDNLYSWQNILDKDGWYEQWQNKVEVHLAKFREIAPSTILGFQNVDLGNWSETVANKLEKQVLYLEKVVADRLEKYGVAALHKSHYDAASKSLYVITVRTRESWAVRVVDFSKTSRPAQILEHIFKAPLEHYDFEELAFIVGDRGHSAISDQDRAIYFALRNINTKIEKDLKDKNFGFLNIENNQVWVDRLHI